MFIASAICASCSRGFPGGHCCPSGNDCFGDTHHDHTGRALGTAKSSQVQMIPESYWPPATAIWGNQSKLSRCGAKYYKSIHDNSLNENAELYLTRIPMILSTLFKVYV
jgi:hypothetical protein